MYYPWSEMGFVVAARASCARETRAAVEADEIDVVLCDIRMPGESGLEFAAWLFAEYPKIRIVLLSAYRKFEYAQEACKYKVCGYLVKPPSYDEFRSIFGAIAADLDTEKSNARHSEVDGATLHAALVADGKKLIDPALANVFTYLHGNLCDACLKSAAKTAKMNPTYFSTWFREKSGKSFSETITGMRMEKAAFLTVERGLRITEVSAELGYSNPKNFSRAFRRHFGTSPNAYRRLTMKRDRD
jgi:YesN/AraC family two-component response regulator